LKKVVPRDLKKHLKVSVEDKISIDFINEVLFEYEFKESILQNRENFLFVVLSMYFLSNDNPYRIEFFGMIESIRSFDVATNCH
jgi:transcription-repair coupling factor (superfamily II helicase)